jgi:hypothetical protein
MIPTKLDKVRSIAMGVVRGNLPITYLSGCIHVLADEIEEIKKKMEEDKKPGER